MRWCLKSGRSEPRLDAMLVSIPNDYKNRCCGGTRQHGKRPVHSDDRTFNGELEYNSHVHTMVESSAH